MVSTVLGRGRRVDPEGGFGEGGEAPDGGGEELRFNNGNGASGTAPVSSRGATATPPAVVLGKGKRRDERARIEDHRGLK